MKASPATDVAGAGHRVYPIHGGAPYGETAFGGQRRGPQLDDLRLVPPALLPDRLSDMARLGREPTALDARTDMTLGGLQAAAPLIVPAMGSTPVAHRHGMALARAAARAGIPLVLGENIATVWGYDERRDADMPTFKERLMAYLDVVSAGDSVGAEHPVRGGIVIQQSVEDAMDELWHRVYDDPDVQEHLTAGRVAFEMKVGQGAKPGLGGVTLVDDATAERLAGDYALGDRAVTQDGKRERFSAPGTFTANILEAQVRHLRNDFPHARIWVKLPPTRDLVAVAHAVAAGGAHCITVDGAEGGTALAPSVFLDHVGLPLTACLAALRRDPPAVDVIASGGLRHGGDVAKVVALGCVAGAMGRGALQATLDDGERGAERFFADVRDEVAMITFAMGHLDVEALDDADVVALDDRLGTMLGVASVFDLPRGLALGREGDFVDAAQGIPAWSPAGAHGGHTHAVTAAGSTPSGHGDDAAAAAVA